MKGQVKRATAVVGIWHKVGVLKGREAGSVLSNWPNTLSHTEVLLWAMLISVPPVCHKDVISTMCRTLLASFYNTRK